MDIPLTEGTDRPGEGLLDSGNWLWKNKRMMNVADEKSVPKQTLSVMDGIALIVGVVIGTGIFKTPSLIAANTGTDALFLLVWLTGGVISLIGALCYAELGAAYPHAGGDFHYLTRAFGSKIAFLFAWARMTVIQPGSIAMLAFVFGDYVSQLFPSWRLTPSHYAALAIATLTALNMMSAQRGKGVQNLLTTLKVIGLFSIIIAGITAAPPLPHELSSPPRPETSIGLAMIFVLLTFGGWNEASYLSAELREARHNMVRVLLWGLGAITAIYLLVSLAYLKGLGLKGMSESEVVAADLMRRIFDEGGAKFVSFLIALSALGRINATIFTGGRTNYALGRNFALFGFLGQWHGRANTPAHALFVQGGIALILVLLGTLTRKGFVTMVDYTAPVFWFFFLCAGISLFVLRTKEPEVTRPFRVPFYPFTPLFFCATCVYMLRSSLLYTRVGAVAGVIVLLAGALLLPLARGEGKEKRTYG
jgi:basic amino acid/polyamine antiporter, APA family